MDIEVIPPRFDLYGRIKYQVEIVINRPTLSYRDKTTKLLSLIQEAYEQGIMDAKKDQDYFNDYGEK